MGVKNIIRGMLCLIHKDQLQPHNSDEGLSSFTKISVN